MKVTKFVHSCVLIEDENKAVLFDPGIYSWQSGLVDVTNFPKLAAVVVTHKHGDHMAEPFVKAIVAAQPDIQWFAPADAHMDLKAMGVKQVTDQGEGDFEIRTVPHAKVVPFGVKVDNLMVHWRGKVTHPGDTHDFSDSKDVLLLPVQAPWGTTIRACELGQELKPKFILPIHDWMWVEDWRNTAYDRLEQIFADTPTQIIRPIDGKPSVISV